MRPSESKHSALHDRNQKSTQLNPEVARELFSHRSGFDYVREVAIARLEKTINNQLDILMADAHDYSNIEQFSNKIFTWSTEEYLKRRSQKNCVWIDVLKKELKGDCLDRFKLQTDLKEVQIFIKLIFEGLQKSPDNFDLESLVCVPLREAERNLDILEILYVRKAELNESLKEQKYLINERVHSRRSTKEEQSFFGIEESMTTAQAWFPIQMRYESNWYQCQTAQALLGSNLLESNAQMEIEKYKFKLFLEEMSGDTIRDNYYILIEQFKLDLELLQNRFNIKFDEIDNKINYTRSEISKMVEQRKLLAQKINRFHEEIKNRTIKDEIESEKLELNDLRIKRGKRNASKRNNKKRAQQKMRQKQKKKLKAK